MKRDKIFLTLISSLLLSLSISLLVINKKEVSVIENRPLTSFPIFSIKNFISTTFQNDMEDALVDQVVFGEEVKSRYNMLKNKTLNFTVKNLSRFEHEPQFTYIPERKNNDTDIPHNLKFQMNLIPRGNSLIEIEKSHHLILGKRREKEAKEDFKRKADNYNQLVENYPNIKFNLFYIETDADVDFVNGEINHSFVSFFKDSLDPKLNFSALYINNPLDYLENFYKTDHHWDVRGQFKGYRGIIKSLKEKDEDLLNIETVEIPDIKYNGSRSRIGNLYSSPDDFKILVADLKEHKTYINGVESTYGRKQDYVNDNFEEQKGLNYYGDCNGNDFGVVHFDFNREKEDNLLVFVDSFSNPIKEFIASHYNNTYFIDLRHYKDTYGDDFDFGNFVSEHDIDQVLFTGYYTFFAREDFLVTD